MATTRDIIRYNIGIIANTIHRIKEEATTDGLSSNELPHINPKHPSWGRYCQLKKEASIWLTMLSLVKAAANERTDIVVHSGNATKRAMFSKANRRLRRLANRLDNNPGKFAVVDAWASAKRDEMAKA